MIELTDAWSRLIFTALGGTVKSAPLRIPRPGEDTRPPLVRDMSEVAKILGGGG